MLLNGAAVSRATVDPAQIATAVDDFLTANPPSVANGSITDAKLANMADGTFKGRLLGSGAGTPVNMTPAQARTTMDVPQTTRAIATRWSMTGGGTLAADMTFNLVGDTASPGNNKLYGTDGTGNRGWYDVPSGALSSQAQATLLGRASGAGTGLPTALAESQARAVVKPENTVAARLTSRRGNTVTDEDIKNWRGPDVVSPYDFGFVGDGNNDETASLQKAIVEAVYNTSGGRPIRSKVMIPTGTGVHKVGALDLTYPTLGAGGAGVAGSGAARDARLVWIEGESNTCRIGWTHSAGPGMTLPGTYCKLRNVIFENATGGAREALLPTAWQNTTDLTQLGNTVDLIFDASLPGLVFQNNEIASQNATGTDYNIEIENVEVYGQKGHGIIVDRPELVSISRVVCLRNVGHGIILVGASRATTPFHIGISNRLFDSRFQENIGCGIVLAYTTEVILENFQVLSNRGVFPASGSDPLFPMDTGAYFGSFRQQVLLRQARSVYMVNPDIECQRASLLGVDPASHSVVGIRFAGSTSSEVRLGTVSAVEYAFDLDSSSSVSIVKPRCNNNAGSFVSGATPFPMQAIVRTRVNNRDIEVNLDALDTNVLRHIEYADAGAEKSISRGVVYTREVGFAGSRPSKLLGAGNGAASSQSADWLPGFTWFRADTGLTEMCVLPGSTTTALSGITATGSAGDIWLQVSGTTGIARNSWIAIAGNAGRSEVDAVVASATVGTATGTSGAATVDLVLTLALEVGQRITISGNTYRITSVPSTLLLSGTYGVSPNLAGTVTAGTSVTRPAHIRVGVALPTGFNPSAAVVSLASPAFSVLSTEEVDLGANQYAASNSTDTALEARTDRRDWMWSAPIIANGTYLICFWGRTPVTHEEISAATWSGGCSVQIKKAGANVNGFGSAVALTNALTNTSSTESFAEGNKIEVVVTGASSLTGVAITGKAVRTGE